jgi:hypothetical protein
VVVSKPPIDSDELTAFVAATLKAIAAGVVEAADHSSVQNDGFVYSFDMPKKVTFDIAVTAKRNTAGKGGLSVQIASILSGESKISHERGSEEISRIAFDVKWRAVDRMTDDRPINPDRYSELNDD